MLDVSGALAALVDDSAPIGLAPSLAGIPAITVPRPPSDVRSVPTAHRRDSLAPACILFTSGSTGRPKGIVWPQATLTKDARAGHDILGIAPGDRVGLVMPIEFVAGMVVANWALTAGAALCLFDPRRHPISELAPWIEREQVTTLHATPTLLRALLRAIDSDQRFPDLRLVTTCGEPITYADVGSARRHLSDRCAFVNWTGSSEVGVLALSSPVPNGLRENRVRFPQAGPWMRSRSRSRRGTWMATPVAPRPRPRPMASWSSSPTQSPWGTATVRADLADRITASGTARRYRTGDLATVDASGELRLLGRCDDAIKINGYLVEPSREQGSAARLRQRRRRIRLR